MAAQPTPNPWPRRLIGAATLVLIPLFAFGGSVTTLGAGMAVKGWWNAEGSFMPLFPIDKWFRDVNTFVEHSHRQFGLLLGLLMLAACVATLRFDRRRAARVLVILATLAVSLQGWLGGSRVLLNSPELAFLHGTFAQAVFAFLCAVFVYTTARWRTAEPARYELAPGLSRAALAASLIVFGQIALGAWYRHALRTGLAGNVEMRFGLHAIGALAALVVVLVLAARLAAAAPAAPSAPLAALRRNLLVLVGVQIGLGFLAWGARRAGEVTFFEWLAATLHVLVGALLLAHCVAAAMWAHRAFAARAGGAGEPAAPSLGGAR